MSSAKCELNKNFSKNRFSKRRGGIEPSVSCGCRCTLLLAAGLTPATDCGVT